MTDISEATGNKTARSEDKTIVYYDGSCPLCTAEISLYRKKSVDVAFVDVSSETTPRMDDLTQEKAMARFHVRRRDGELLDGAAAFAELWQQTPGFRSLGRFLHLPGLTSLANVAYAGFLLIRPALHKVLRLRNKQA